MGLERTKIDRRTITLVNDDSPAKPWIDKFKRLEAFIKSQPPKDYAPLPSDFNLTQKSTANSNTWCHFLLLYGGLMDQYYHARQKLPGKDLPIATGWNIDYPYNHH